MDILISDAYIPVSGGFSRGYVYISEGRVSEVGEGEPPDDLKVSQLHYPIHGGVVLRGLSSAYTDLSLYWARGLLGRGISYADAVGAVNALDWRKAVSICAAALRDLTSRGFTFFGTVARDPRVAEYIEREIGVHAVWIFAEEQRAELSFPVLTVREGDYPIMYVGDGGVIEVVWRDGSRSLCSPRHSVIGERDSLCVELSMSFDFPDVFGDISPDGLPQYYGWTSGNAYRQLLGLSLGLELKRGEPANLVVIRPDHPPATGLDFTEVALMFHTGGLGPSAIDTVISFGNIIVDRGEPLAIGDSLLAVAHSEIKAMRRALMRK